MEPLSSFPFPPFPQLKRWVVCVFAKDEQVVISNSFQCHADKVKLKSNKEDYDA